MRSHVAHGLINFHLRNVGIWSGKDGGGLALGYLKQLAITDEIGYLEAGESGLASSEKLLIEPWVPLLCLPVLEEDIVIAPE